MVDTPKEGNGDGTAGDDPSKKQPKRRRAALSPAKAKTVIPAREIITPRTVPKTTPSSKIQRRRMEKPAPLREWQTESKRMITTCLPPKTRQASATTNLSCLRIPSNKSALSPDLWLRQVASRKNSNN